MAHEFANLEAYLTLRGIKCDLNSICLTILKVAKIQLYV